MNQELKVRVYVFIDASDLFVQQLTQAEYDFASRFHNQYRSALRQGIPNVLRLIDSLFSKYQDAVERMQPMDPADFEGYSKWCFEEYRVSVSVGVILLATDYYAAYPVHSAYHSRKENARGLCSRKRQKARCASVDLPSARNRVRHCRKENARGIHRRK